MININFINATNVKLVDQNNNTVSTVGEFTSPTAYTCSENKFSKNDQNYYHFAITGSNVQLCGVIGEVTTKQQYLKLFEGCEQITNASQLQLTGTVMKESCYAGMFLNCTNLKTPPTTLPATTLAMWCYSSMFAGCSSLSASPSLPATNLAPYCYYAMFYNCLSLSTSPYLPAQTLVDWCYNSMFYNCQNLNEIECDFTAWNGNATSSWVTNVAENGRFLNDNVSIQYNNSKVPTGWKTDYLDVPLTFRGLSSINAISLNKQSSPYNITLNYKKNNGQWTNYTIGDTVELNQNQTVAFSGNNNNFSKDFQNFYYFAMTGTIKAKGNIQSLVNYSENVTSNSYENLFNSCYPLITAPALPATGLATGCYESMFDGCSSLVTPPALPATTLCGWCYNYMFIRCYSLSAAPQLPARVMKENCYKDMFAYCSSLVDIPSLQATNLASACYLGMFSDCTALTTTVYLPTVSLYGAQACYANMFEGCTSLTNAVLPIKTLYAQSCQSMFKGCSSLSSIEVNLEGWSPSNATSSWVSGVAANGTFTKPRLLYANTGVDAIPNGWTIIDK